MSETPPAHRSIETVDADESNTGARRDDVEDVPAASTAGGPRILVVDDDAYVHVGIRAALKGLRGEIRTASSGREALEIMAEFRPQVAILDVGLPDTDGYQLADDLRALHDFAGLRIIFLTGYLPDQLSVDVAGGNLFLGKPYRMHVLLDAVKRQLGAVAAGE
jgi:DNA-binding response OmpR family regulator